MHQLRHLPAGTIHGVEKPGRTRQSDRHFYLPSPVQGRRVNPHRGREVAGGAHRNTVTLRPQLTRRANPALRVSHDARSSETPCHGSPRCTAIPRRGLRALGRWPPGPRPGSVRFEEARRPRNALRGAHMPPSLAPVTEARAARGFAATACSASHRPWSDRLRWTDGHAARLRRRPQLTAARPDTDLRACSGRHRRTPPRPRYDLMGAHTQRGRPRCDPARACTRPRAVASRKADPHRHI
jgi:hypothetical protein